MTESIERREFLAASALAMAPRAKNVPKLNTTAIRSYNPDMEYRPLGKTGVMFSAVCLGGHWKRVATMMPAGFKGVGYAKEDLDNANNPVFLKNRADVVSRCMELGINYVDACAPPEILAYSKVLKGRRDRMYLGFSWYTREPRFPEWRTAKKLLEGFDLSLKEAGLDDVDLWRITLPVEGIPDMGLLNQVEEATVEALDKARQQGKARFTGISSHNRTWLKYLIEHYPSQIQVVLFPYTADSSVLPEASVFEAVQQHQVGVLGIKPFADNSLFAGDGSLASPQAEEDSKRARLAIRYILENPGITAPIPGMVNPRQVENVAQAVLERKREGKLSPKQRTELEDATRGMWARLRPGYAWLKEWREV